jgi:exoribonuclease II
MQVGIHIADVSRFVTEGSSLDVAASRRHATQYLRVPASFGRHAPSLEPVSAASAALGQLSLDAAGPAGDDAAQSIMRIPMLPPDVSEICSLNPNVDRYAVTVIFTVNEEVRSYEFFVVPF